MHYQLEKGMVENISDDVHIFITFFICVRRVYISGTGYEKDQTFINIPVLRECLKYFLNLWRDRA